MNYLGQHFLKNEKAVGLIVDALRLREGQTVIEIGPGTGALTLPLLERCKLVGCRYIGIEKDETLATNLGTIIKKYEVGSKDGALKIITGDALRVLPTLLHNSNFILPNRYAIVGNIPYYITGNLLRVISELPNKPVLTVLMTQKEVAQRITARPPEMNLLAAATQVWAQPEILMKLAPTDFDPPPAVHSAIIELTTHNKQLTTEELQKYYAALHRIFKQPRKTLLNNLAAPVVGESLPPAREEVQKIIASLGLPVGVRPQNLSIPQITEINKRFSF